ncbi:hypothetical protein MT418_001167 [Batrachochytrium dendrobatidis]
MSTVDLPSMVNEPEVPETKQAVKLKKKTKKVKKSKASKLPRDMVTNDKGELVTTKEYTLEKVLEATAKSLKQTQERMMSLVQTNELLNETCQQQEKDALEVIAALHQECESKNKLYKDLQDQMAEQERQFKIARDAVIEESSRNTAEINGILSEKEAAFKIMQQEFSVIKDFRKKRMDLMQNLDEQKHELDDTEKRHKEIIIRLERKFFEEKIRLQKEASRKISELATKAHKEAVLNLNETTKEVYKENIRMAEALQYHVQEGEELSKANIELTQANRQLSEEKDLHNVIVKEKIIKAKTQEKEIKDLKLKISSMEHSLSHVVREFEYERTIIGDLARHELNQVREVADKLRASLARKTLEMKHIKRLAQHILNQRTELEQFFLEALEMVKSEMKKAREKQLKEAQMEYDKRMRTMFKDRAPIPPVQSFRIQNKNPLDKFLAETLIDREDKAKSISNKAKIDIKDLTWEDKERVLRILFAKMNGTSLAKAAERSCNQISSVRQGNRDTNGFVREMEYKTNIDHFDMEVQSSVGTETIDDTAQSNFILPSNQLVENGNDEEFSTISISQAASTTPFQTFPAIPT